MDVPADIRKEFKVVSLPHPKGYAQATGIAAKRNFGCEAADGQLIVHWDDDDISQPERIASQVDHLLESGKQVGGFSSMVFHNPETNAWWMYETAVEHFVLGTSLLYFKVWWREHKYPKYLKRGEDYVFAHHAFVRKQLFSEKSAGLMYARLRRGFDPSLLNSPEWTLVTGISAVKSSV
jgi:hypothetical protein